VSLDGEVYHSGSYLESDKQDFSELQFTTDNSWPFGTYLVTIDLMDDISKESTSSQTSFILLEKFAENPEITELKKASEIRGFRDYDSKLIFKRGENISIYQEYTNITTINNETCDIYINITVDNESQVTLHYDEINKNEIGNNAHAWWFVSAETWSTGIYYITSNLIDNISKESTSKPTFFYINE